MEIWTSAFASSSSSLKAWAAWAALASAMKQAVPQDVNAEMPSTYDGENDSDDADVADLPPDELADLIRREVLMHNTSEGTKMAINEILALGASAESPLDGVSGMLGCSMNILSRGFTVGWEQTGLAAASYASNSLGGFSRTGSPFMKPVAGIAANLLDAYLSAGKDISYRFQATDAAAKLYLEATRAAGKKSFRDLFPDDLRSALTGYSSKLALASGIVPGDTARFQHALALESAASELKDMLFGDCEDGRIPCWNATGQTDWLTGKVRDMACIAEGIRWDPTNMPGQARTTSGWHECQARCKSVAGCRHFSWWASGAGGCHLQDENAKAVPTGPRIFSGPPECKESNNLGHCTKRSDACMRRQKAGAGLVLQELAATHFASLADMISMMPEPTLTEEVLIDTFHAVGCPNPAPDTRSWKATADVVRDSSSVIMDMFALCEKLRWLHQNAKGEATQAEAEQCCAVAPCRPKPNCKRLSKFYDSNADAKRLLLEKHGRILASYKSVFVASKYQYLADRLSKLVCELSADETTATCKDNVEIGYEIAKFPVESALKSVRDTAWTRSIDGIKLDMANSFQSVRVVRKRLTQQVMKQFRRGDSLLSGKVVLADETITFTTDGWSHKSVVAKKSLKVTGTQSGSFCFESEDAKKFFSEGVGWGGEDYAGKLFEVVTSTGRQGVVEMEAGGECGAWKEIGKHDYNTLWLDNVPSQEWSVGDHVYFPEDLYHVSARSGSTTEPLTRSFYSPISGKGRISFLTRKTKEMPATTSAKVNGKVVQATVVLENVEDEDEFPVSLVFDAQSGNQEVVFENANFRSFYFEVGKPDSSEQQLPLEAACMAKEKSWTPTHMDGQKRTVGTWQECQQRCIQVSGCRHFSWWEDGGCGIQDEHATEKSGQAHGVISGPPTCSAGYLHQNCVAKGTYHTCMNRGLEIDLNVRDNFVIKFYMRMPKRAHTAASFGFYYDGYRYFRNEMESHFLLDATRGQFWQGSMASGKYWNVGVAKGGEVGRGAETWKPGHWHKWEVALSYGVLLILMDGEVVAQQKLTIPEIHHFQLRPWRNTMDVAGLSVDYAVSTMKVKAISDAWRGSDAGKYFVVDRQDIAVEFESGTTFLAMQCRGGATIWRGQVKMWNSLQDLDWMKKVTMPIHGRKDPWDQVEVGDWEVGDYLTTGIVCPKD
ncbi:ANK1 [Symbiodinium natans]|uniref:ANK1 protein n=1 Tax=Symbiodinium natans TaxID=878477 RepID=A0A812KAW7_9DINO|nr:ANK1 [Symbiodinium natans]